MNREFPNDHFHLLANPDFYFHLKKGPIKKKNQMDQTFSKCIPKNESVIASLRCHSPIAGLTKFRIKTRSSIVSSQVLGFVIFDIAFWYWIDIGFAVFDIEFSDSSDSIAGQIFSCRLSIVSFSWYFEPNCIMKRPLPVWNEISWWPT